MSGIYIAIAAATLLVAAVVFFLMRKKKGPNEDTASGMIDMTTASPEPHLPQKKTSNLPASRHYGKLRILESDDDRIVRKEFEITKTCFLLGRGGENDLAFANDSPVSRKHAQLVFQNNRLYLSQIVQPCPDGTFKTPRFGTYLNGRSINEEQVELRNGDIIQLGRRVKIVVENIPTYASEGPAFEGYATESIPQCSEPTLLVECEDDTDDPMGETILVEASAATLVDPVSDKTILTEQPYPQPGEPETIIVDPRLPVEPTSSADPEKTILPD